MIFKDEKDQFALSLVKKYILDAMAMGNPNDAYIPEECFDVYIVWKCKTLQNWKYLISSSFPDNAYFELTYNGDKAEWYFDYYLKIKNRVFKEKES